MLSIRSGKLLMTWPFVFEPAQSALLLVNFHGFIYFTTNSRPDLFVFANLNFDVDVLMDQHVTMYMC